MAIEERFNISPENPFSGDPSVPRFRYTEKERQERIERGMTEDEITAEEVAITTKQIEAQQRNKAA